MAWFRRKPKPEPKPPIEMIDGWQLSIVEDSGRRGNCYHNVDFKELWKIYKWYLTKDSDKYNVQFNNGMRILHRHNVVTMELTKIKLPKRDWVQENNDETETD